MQVFVGLENGMEGRQLAWALDHPGCYAYGEDGPAAVASIAPAFKMYQDWISHHTADSWLAAVETAEVSLAEIFDCYTIDEEYNLITGDGYEVNAWFRHDWKPLTREEIERGLQVLRFSRADLLPMVQNLPDAVLDRTYPRERWSIRGVLKHIANAEWWYMDRLDLAGVSREALPEDVFERLAQVRARLEAVLPEVEGSKQVLGRSGEFWSPRKVLRRSAWHELDHIEHIGKLLRLTD